MKCYLCGSSNKFRIIYSYDLPDKYEAAAGIDKICRSWARCLECGFYFQLRNYDLKELEVIYKNIYRSKEFRGETIEHAFERIKNIKYSENEQRFWQFALRFKYENSRKVLDIGSGIGIWPNLLKRAEYDVDCVEENELSIDFIYEQLGLRCFNGIENVHGKYDTITIVHVLEHVEDPIKFLVESKKNLRRGGNLFIEVPDSSEFGYLDKDHDEFNSCHVHFYNMASLCKVVESAGFVPVDMHIEKTKQRNLTRLMCFAIN